MMDRAASLFRDRETVGFEIVSEVVGTDLAYAVEIERYRTKLDGRSDLSEVALRVTCVYRREGHAWKPDDRHADPAVTRQPVGTLLVS
ncbi:MAG TPA: hypothetical protein VIR16_06720 [Candidatus Limnocylindrales bacterium]